MAPQIFEGCREIEGAKQRLALANAWKKSAIEMVTSAIRQLESAEREVLAAESFLKETYQKWEVANILDYSESEPDEQSHCNVDESLDTTVVSNDSCEDEIDAHDVSFPSGIVREVTMPNHNDDTITNDTPQPDEQSDCHVDEGTAVSSDLSGDEIGAHDVAFRSGIVREVTVPNHNEDTFTKNTPQKNGGLLVEQIVVEGGGVPEVNGTYRRCGTINDGLPLCFDKNIPAWSKRGLWEGETVDIYIFYDQFSRRWNIAYQTETQFAFVYSSYRLDAELPPQNNGWFVSGSKGLSPAPILKWYVACSI
mmetsp:Transcript_22702/g.38882  ORF Transcript_22702/g.38882 Transcript_22702/m.38882 type:complete len:308 (-) Transcript_22702:149-1072(-)